ncbi:MAG TPA: polyphosphate polymerase domain-containing protein [Polyangiaceae bacterium]|nr:polyphosphate polymerase domain-containing protein [Polyangiaceae bacterium]
MVHAAVGARLGADAAITADRNELTYLVPLRQWQALVQHFDEHLPAQRYLGEGDSTLPAPQYLVSTVYFDTPTRRLFRDASSQAHDNVKLRAREYYDVLPSWAERAARVEEEVGPAAGQIWLELKRRAGARTQKHRVRIGKTVLQRWLHERSAPSRSDYVGRDADAQVLEAYFEASAESFEPTCVVNYQRCSWQSPDGGLRLTLDSNLAFYAPPADLFGKSSLRREELGAACAREDGALLEVKQRAQALPTWLAARLTTLGLFPSDYSKFVKAAGVVGSV